MLGGTSTHVCHICRDADDGVEQLLSPDGSRYRYAHRVTCQRCGVYHIGEAAAEVLDRPDSLNAAERYQLAGITRMASDRGETIEITLDSLRDLLSTIPEPTVPDQIDALLRWIVAEFRPGCPVDIEPLRDYARFGAHGPKGLQYLLRNLQEEDLIRLTEGMRPPHYEPTHRAFAYIAEKDLARSAILASIAVSGSAGWERTLRELEKARNQLANSTHEEDFQIVGQLCGQALISAAQAVYDPEKHKTIDGVPASPTDAKRMIEAYVAVELAGADCAAERQIVRNAATFAEATKHGRTSDRLRGQICIAATEAVLKMIGAISGRAT